MLMLMATVIRVRVLLKTLEALASGGSTPVLDLVPVFL